jgi:hypothetical protein
MFEVVSKNLVDEGIQQGIQQGQAQILSRQLAKRFGPAIAEGFSERLEKASPEQADAWADRLLDAKTVEDVFDD